MTSHSLETTAPGEVWRRWLDVETWREWDSEIQSASLEGEFKLGAKGTLKPRTGPETSFTVTELTPQQRYTFTTDLPLCKLHVKRYFSDDNTTFTHEVGFAGTLAPLFGFLLGRRFQKVLPTAMTTLRKLAEASKDGVIS